MQVDRSTFSLLTERATQAREGQKDAPRELELRCTFPIHRTAFTDALTYYKHVAKTDVRESRETVAASVEGHRVTLDPNPDPGAEEAEKAALHRPMMLKQRVAPAVDIPEYGLRLNLKSEVPVPPSSLATRDVVARALAKPREGEPVLIRDKHRFSCAVAPDVRVDLTVVRQWRSEAPLEDDVRDRRESAETVYEAEVEFVPRPQPSSSSETTESKQKQQRGVGKKKKKGAAAAAASQDDNEVPQKSAEEVVKTLLRVASVMLKTLHNVQYLLPESVARGARQEYANLVAHLTYPRPPPFIGPKPVTLMQENLCGIVRDGAYTLTEKADGERRFLMVDRTGRVFTMDDRLAVSFTGLTSREPAEDAATLMDGEYLPATADRPYPMFLAFDVYFWAGKDVRSMPLMTSSPDLPSRLSLGQKFLSRLERFESRSPDHDCRCVMKTFYAIDSGLESLHEAVRNVVRRREARLFPYDVDGLIFTPARLAVGQEASSKQQQQQDRKRRGDDGSGRCVATTAGRPSNGGTWRMAFKWKPPEMNTVDFMVRFRVDEPAPSPERVLVDLYVGRDVSADPDPVGPLTFFSSDEGRAPRFDKKKKKVRDYRAVLFEPRDVPVEERGAVQTTTLTTDARGVPYTTQHNEEIPDGGVVEFSYRGGDGEGGGGSWVPLRNRHDKKMPNSLENAESVWRSIRFPIRESVLAGADPEARAEAQKLMASCAEAAAVVDGVVDAGRYYVRDTTEVDRKSLGLYPMNQFHNWIKSRLLRWFSGRGDVRALLDLGSGKGGDIPKWLAMDGLERVLGLDLYVDSIVDPVDGAYARLRKQQQRQRKDGSSPTIAFVAYDLREPLDGNGIRAMDDAHGNRAFAHVLWGLRDSAGIRDPQLRKMHGFATQPFDIVSCQFAIHYFFSSGEVLRTFARNVADSLRPGGYFLGTCMDGTAVDVAMRSKARGDAISSSSRDASTPLLWHIQKLYDGSMADVTEPSERLGFAVRVYLESIGQAQVEYLVDFQTLRAEMARVGLVPVSPPASEGGLFEDTPGSGSFQTVFRAMKKAHEEGGDEGEGEASRISSALSMTDAHRAYSFFNRWFLFRKQSDDTNRR